MEPIERELVKAGARYEAGIAQLQADRDEVIRRAAKAGLTQQRIGQLVGISFQRVSQIVGPKPRGKQLRSAL